MFGIGLGYMGLLGTAGGFVLPSGALGVWDATNYSASTKTIPNTIAGASQDSNILVAPRRQFNNSYYWDKYRATITDSASTAPDGSNDATTVTGGGGGVWWIQGTTSQTRLGVTRLVNGQTYTIACSVKSLSGGSLDFRLGEFYTGFSTFTATTSWQRFTKTFTAGATPVLMFRDSDGTTAANHAICDFEVFAGSSDLNPNPLSAPPLRVTNADLVLHRDASTVTGGVLTHGSTGLIQVKTSQSVGPFTVLIVGIYGGSSFTTGYQSILSKMDSSGPWANFSVGPSINLKFGSSLGGSSIDASPSPISLAMNNNFPPGADSAFGAGAGPFVSCHRYDGSTSTVFINGKKIANNAIVKSSTWIDAVANTLGFGANYYSGYNIYFLAYYPSALSDAQVYQAQSYLASKYALGTSDIIIYVGSSITAGVSATGAYPEQSALNLNPLRFGVNWGHASYNLANISAASSLIDSIITTGPASRRYILSCEIGVNDLGLTFPYNGNPNGFTAAYATFLDARRAAGWKVVVNTIMQRLDATQSDGGVQFAADRATANATIGGWVGVHCDALADWAANATMGTNTSPNNATYFAADKVHPITAGHTILETITRPAINSL